jgi:methylmalonyl-CoA/ethylmalonyl-CoA epimerase
MHAQAIDHIGIVVADLRASERTYEQLGFGVRYRERIEEHGVDITGMSAGECTIELLKPLSAASPLQRYLGGKPSRLHHLAYRVADIEAEIRRLSDAGMKLIDRQPRRGAQGNRIAFIDPQSTGGVLLELCQKPPKP